MEMVRPGVWMASVDIKCHFAHLRSQSHQSVIYLDDAYMQWYAYSQFQLS